MTLPHKTQKAKLVIVIAPFELQEHIATDLRRLGARGFTTLRVDGTGSHGPRRYGLLDSANYRFDVVGSPELAEAILQHVAAELPDRGVVAYSLDVEAVPFDHFG